MALEGKNKDIICTKDKDRKATRSASESFSRQWTFAQSLMIRERKKSILAKNWIPNYFPIFIIFDFFCDFERLFQLFCRFSSKSTFFRGHFALFQLLLTIFWLFFGFRDKLNISLPLKDLSLSKFKAEFLLLSIFWIAIIIVGRDCI